MEGQISFYWHVLILLADVDSLKGHVAKITIEFLGEDGPESADGEETW